MQVKINIPDELAAAARARGLQPEAYAEEILARELEVRRAGSGRLATPEEIRAWLDSLAQFSERIPPLPEAISREWIYQEHD